MVRTILLALGMFLLGSSICFPQARPPSDRVPVLVELFTSEGCSSCPPADRLLEVLDSQPIPGIEIIVLSEHVDYWNHDGWTDAYSSPEFTERQRRYASHFKMDDVYTPQLVIDGCHETSGNDVKKVEASLREARSQEKTNLHITQIVFSYGQLHAHIDSPPLSQSTGHSLGVYLVLALNHAESQVTRGENANHRLTHTAVVHKIRRVGKLTAGQPFSQDVDFKVDSRIEPGNLRLVAFVQEENSGKIAGSTMRQVK